MNVIAFVLLLCAIPTAGWAGWCAARADHHFHAAMWFTLLAQHMAETGAVPTVTETTKLWPQAEAVHLGILRRNWRKRLAETHRN